jgi:acetyltransferase
MPVDVSKSSYPAWLETTERLRDGTEIHLRPLRPEDETLLEDLAAHMSREDLRLRFFAAVRGLSHAAAARLSHIDYDRAMALLAEKDGVALGSRGSLPIPTGAAPNTRSRYGATGKGTGSAIC